MRRHDEAIDRQTLLLTTGLIALGFGVGASVQSAWIYSRFVPVWAEVELWRRLVVNGTSVVALVAVLGVLGVHRARGVALVTRLLLACALMAVLRVTLQVVFGVYDADDRTTLAGEVVTGLFVATIATGIGVWGMLSRRRARARVRAAERDRLAVELAAQAVEDAEVRVRRSVAEGRLEQRLLLAGGALRMAGGPRRGTVVEARLPLGVLEDVERLR